MEIESVQAKVSEVPKLGESELGSKSITYLFWKYSLFAVFGLSMQVVQSFFDATFVGNGIGPYGFAVTTIASSFWMLAVGLCGLFGIGGSTLAAIKLGAGDLEGAREVYGVITVFSFVVSAIISLIMYIFLKPLLVFMGATPDIIDGCISYSIYYLIGLPFAITAAAAYYFTRVAEKPQIASVAYIAPALIAIGVEYYGIFKAHIGIPASSIAAMLSMGLPILLLPYIQAANVPFKLRMSDLKINFKVLSEACKIGFAMFIIPFSVTGALMATNNMIIASGGGQINLAAYGVLQFIAYFFFILTTAFITGIQPIVSYNLGAGFIGRIQKLIMVGVVQSSIAIIIILSLVYYFAAPIILFLSPDPSLLAAARGAMIIFMALYAFGNISQVASGYFMAVERNWLAILNGVARMTIFALPLIFILPKIYGLKGVWMAQPGADALSFILAVICLVREYRRLGKMKTNAG